MSDPSAAIAQLVAQATVKLQAVGTLNPDRDVRLLLAYHWDVPSDVVYPPYSHPQLLQAFAQGALQMDGFFETIAARAQGRPVSKIIGARDFWKHRFWITDDVLDPRPETETLIEWALEEPFDTVLDLGTGSGCILLSLLADRPEARGVGVDVSDAALAVACENARRLDVSDRAALFRSNWFSEVSGVFDLIVSNPPYIAESEMSALAADVRLYDPQIALTPGGDGLSAYHVITAGVAPYLASNGRLVVEIGPTQARAVSDLMQEAGFENITVHSDLDGRDRVVSGHNP